MEIGSQGVASHHGGVLSSLHHVSRIHDRREYGSRRASDFTDVPTDGLFVKNSKRFHDLFQNWANPYVGISATWRRCVEKAVMDFLAFVFTFQICHRRRFKYLKTCAVATLIKNRYMMEEKTVIVWFEASSEQRICTWSPDAKSHINSTYNL